MIQIIYNTSNDQFLKDLLLGTVDAEGETLTTGLGFPYVVVPEMTGGHYLTVLEPWDIDTIESAITGAGHTFSIVSSHNMDGTHHVWEAPHLGRNHTVADYIAALNIQSIYNEEGEVTGTFYVLPENIDNYHVMKVLGYPDRVLSDIV